MFTDFKMPDALCPCCGYKFNRASNTRGTDKPVVGDFSVCINCGALLRFDANLVPVLTDDKFYEDLTDKQQQMVRVIQKFIRDRGFIEIEKETPS